MYQVYRILISTDALLVSMRLLAFFSASKNFGVLVIMVTQMVTDMLIFFQVNRSARQPLHLARIHPVLQSVAEAVHKVEKRVSERPPPDDAVVKALAAHETALQSVAESVRKVEERIRAMDKRLVQYGVSEVVSPAWASESVRLSEAAPQRPGTSYADDTVFEATNVRVAGDL